MSSVTDRRSEPAFAAHASGPPATGRATGRVRHVAAIRWCCPGWSGRRGVKGEVTSLLHPFLALSPSLAFPLARQAVAPPLPSPP